MFKISSENPLRLIELFGGIGCQANGIKKAGIPFVHWGYVEFDKYPVKSYNAIWGTDFATQDICNVHASDLHIEDTDKHTYLMTYSFPCTDLSVAGKGAGMAKGSGTRSGLLWEVERILNECEELPQILLMENVPQVHGKKNISDFNQWLEFLGSKGYHNIWKDLNAKDYGIAQNRKRTFMISCLQPIDWYQWPDTIPLDTVMGDYLDDEVDKKFYVNNDRADNLVQKLIDDGDWISTSFNDRENRIGNIYGATGGSFAGMVYDSKHLSPALTTMGGGGRMPHIITKLGNIYPNPSNFKGNGRGGVYAMNGIVPTITTMTGGGDRLHTVYVSRLVPESGKIHQNQEIWGGKGYARQ